jgi:hypothetical protein
MTTPAMVQFLAAWFFDALGGGARNAFRVKRDGLPGPLYLVGQRADPMLPLSELPPCLGLPQHPHKYRPQHPILLAVDTQQSPKKWRCVITKSTRVTSPFVTVTCSIRWKVSRNSNTPEGEKKVARVRVCVREDRGALSDGVPRKMIEEFDERIRPVAPVDAACACVRPLDVKALESLDALEAEHLRRNNRPRDARTTVVRNPGVEERNGEGVPRRCLR